MAFGKKKAASKPTEAKSVPGAPKAVSAAKTIEAKAVESTGPSEDEIFLAVLSGLVSKYGALDGDGQPALELADRARTFAQKESERKKR